MRFTAYPKINFCLALLLVLGSCVPPITAQPVQLHAWHELVILGDVAAARVQTPRGDYSAISQSEARVFPNGEARGFLTLSPTDSGSSHSGGMNVVFADGSVRFQRDGTVARVLLRGRTEEGDHIVVFITPAAAEDCLIYTTVGSDVHATWEAPGRLTVIR